jgi:DNA-binding HxlR family transcriptional regulator
MRSDGCRFETTAPMLWSNAMNAPDVYEDRCPTRLVLDRIADKWAVLILDHLQDGPVRFNQLRRTIKGISQKVLSQTLKKLERDGLISRSVFATVPVTVEYALTPLGRTLTDTVAALARWAENNIEAVLAAQQAYDSGGDPAAPAEVSEVA